MTVEDFYGLDEMEQLEAVWEAKYIGLKEDDLYIIKLYQIDAFYVEDYFDKARDGRVRFMALFKEEVLDAYLEGFESI